MEKPVFRVKNWAEFQHYKKRNPPWIRLYRKLLDDRLFMDLPDASRALAPCMWLLASESEDGTVPADLEDLAWRLRKTKAWMVEALKPLVDQGFLEDASNVLARRLQRAIPDQIRGRSEADQIITTPGALRPSEAPSGDAVFLTIPTNIKEAECPIFASQVTSWKTTFPAVDVEQQIREARQWCIDNPTKRKTYRGMTKFINSWLSRRQNAGGSSVTKVGMSQEERIKEIEGRASK